MRTIAFRINGVTKTTFLIEKKTNKKCVFCRNRTEKPNLRGIFSTFRRGGKF